MQPYIIHDTFQIATSPNGIYSSVFILRDKKNEKPEKLQKLFKNSYKVFRVRVRDLGNLETKTTAGEADALRIMLEALITIKNEIT